MDRNFLLGQKSAKQWKTIFESKEFEETFYYDINDLGANYQKEKTIFKIWAPTAKEVFLNLYSTGSDTEQNARKLDTIAMNQKQKAIWEIEVQGDLNGIYYTYTINANDTTKETSDIYAKACGVNGLRSMVIDLEQTNPDGWNNDYNITYPLEKTQIWEIHIGDFSNDINSGVRPEYRGKYLAFTQDDTVLDNDTSKPTCLNYLKTLGITHVHLLPTFDFGSIDEANCENKFNWGYDPLNYNVPEGSYSTNPFDGSIRIKEFKQMVMALHKAGISVVMDVVYNHTHSLDSNFNYTVPYYYYRQLEDGSYSNCSDCGNDTASERKMFQKYMIDSVIYWIKEYHIDGFRFDLMGLHDVGTMNKIRTEVNKLNKDIIIYGEPWSAKKVKTNLKMADKSKLQYLENGISVFNDDTRDSIKGSYKKLEAKGFVNGANNFEAKIKRAVLGLIDKDYIQPKSPAQVINYVSAHDNNTLWDKLVYSVKGNNDFNTKYEDLVSMNKLAAAIVQFSKGIPFMQAGEEAGRTKQGNDNSYASSKQLNQLDWKRMYDFKELIDYYKGLIKVHNSFYSFHNLDYTNNITFFENLPKKIVAYKITDELENQKFKEIIVIFNASNKDYNFKLEKGNWALIVNENMTDKKGIKILTDEVNVKSISTYILAK